jgi:hypothetical protein
LRFIVKSKRPGGGIDPTDPNPVRVRLAWYCNYGNDTVMVDAVTGDVVFVARTK